MNASHWTSPGDLLAELDHLHQQLERAFGQGRGTTPNIRTTARGTFPPINVGSTPEAVEIFAFAPGLDASALEVSIDKGLLTLAGERRSADGGDAGEGRVSFLRERPQGSFRRVVALPEDCDPMRVQASYRNGVVHVRIEKREASRPRRIAVSDAA